MRGMLDLNHIYGHKNMRKLTSKYHMAITETEPLDNSLENMVGRMHRTTPLKPNLAMVSCLPYPWWYPRPEGPEQKSPPSTGQKTNKSTAGNISCIVGGFIPDWLTKKLVIRLIRQKSKHLQIPIWMDSWAKKKCLRHFAIQLLLITVFGVEIDCCSGHSTSSAADPLYESSQKHQQTSMGNLEKLDCSPEKANLIWQPQTSQLQNINESPTSVSFWSKNIFFAQPKPM
jgi:hypothetical protein